MKKKVWWPAEISCSLKKKNWTACNVRNFVSFRVSWKCTQNTSKINPCTVLVQEITNEDHNYCKHCDWNISDSLPALKRANVSVFFWGLPFHFVSRPARASPVHPSQPLQIAELCAKKMVPLLMLCCYCAATQHCAVEECSRLGWGTVKKCIEN